MDNSNASKRGKCAGNNIAAVKRRDGQRADRATWREESDERAAGTDMILKVLDLVSG
jgi:hypothetical protein